MQVTKSGITRREMVAGLALAPAAAASAADAQWMELFDGRSLKGWRASEHKTSWKVDGGQLVCSGPRSHLFYTGREFKNFELEVEACAPHAANSGVYFHTRYQDSGFPDKGFEIQICNSLTGKESYQPRSMTGSLYGLRNIYKPLAVDNEWFTLRVAVRGKNIQVSLNGMPLVDYTEPTPAIVPAGGERGRYLDRGTFALQCHDETSRTRFRKVRVRPLADDEATPGGTEVAVDDVFRKVIDYGRHNIPMADLHVHLKGGLTIEQVLAKSRKDGIQYGIAVNCGKGFPVGTDEQARAFVDSMKGAPVFLAMQAEGREWVQMFSRQAAALFDYIFTDSMTWTDNHGKRMRTWIANEVGTIADPQEFMETLVDRAVGILTHEPIDIYVNPTFLPDQIARDYETLWTEERRVKVARAAVKNGVAIELNNRYKLPHASFVKTAKALGAKFTFGTNNGGAADLGRCEYGLQMIEECGLKWQDFWVPLKGPKAIERKSGGLRS